MLLVVFKVLLTLPVAWALAWPLVHPSVAGGIFSELEALGSIGAWILTLVFLIAVFFYCRDLQRSLTLVKPSSRVASPRSVWLMFLLPYNFIEDFFIVAHVARSLRREARHNKALGSFKSFGLFSGLGWCTAQIVSLLPNELGSLGGALALPLWIVHWQLVRRVNRLMALA
ncbi:MULTISPECIES: hypothetical protein [unclassified Pseudomonas]|uniref:hypothetical protein n=1 Tax=unclassified Pseudomonas TaxID=196821 RepID=UPI000CD12EB8|nr:MULTISPECIES: hypothetical protein [unclassified Pseudomonas]POA31817.1 hypothetical protein C1887_11730 [Pseudomonas sp. GW456-R21]POA68548.1 hypothetical protein C1884_09375 [Pseudomonas sp. GW460-R15]